MRQLKVGEACSVREKAWLRDPLAVTIVGRRNLNRLRTLRMALVIRLVNTLRCRLAGGNASGKGAGR